MRTVTFLAWFFLVSTVMVAWTPDKQKIRLLYQKSATNEQACKKLIKMLNLNNIKEHPLLLGYKGSAVMMMAKHVINPFKKWSYYKKGKNMLQKAIKNDKQNIELRFLRFTIQINLPPILGYDDHVKSDKTFIMNNLSNLPDNDLKRYLIKSLKSMNIELNLKANTTK